MAADPGTMEWIWSWVSPWTLIGLIPIVFVWFYRSYKKALEGGHKTDLTTLRERMVDDSWSVRYRDSLTAALDWFDIKLAPDSVLEGTETTDWRRAWTARSYDWCLLFAVAYPIFFLILQWGLFNGSGTVGTMELLKDDAVWWQRALLFLSLLVLTISLVWYHRAQAQGRRGYMAAALGLVAAAFAFAAAGAVAGAVAVRFAVAFAAAVTVAVAFAAAFAFAFAVTAAAAVAVPAAVTAAAAVAFAAAGAFATAGAVAVPAAVTVAFIWIYEKLEGSHPLLARSLIYVFFVAAVLLLIVSGAPDDLEGWQNAMTLLLFYGLLPLINALFDWASFGLTRLFLRWGVAPGGKGAFFWGFADVGAAVLLFTGLGMVIISAIHAANVMLPAPLFDLAPLFAGLRSAPGDYWWLYATLFSTLLPTVLHFGIMLASAVTLIPKRFRHWIGDMILRHDQHLMRDRAAMGLAAHATASLILPLVLIGLLIVSAHIWAPWLGTAYLVVFESWALFIGAPVEIGPAFPETIAL